jgi:glutathione synthase/RimK-type ligase-like ATP-grasp enzyme
VLIYLVTDYKGNFGSKCKDLPYRSGFNKELLVHFFKRAAINIEFLNPSRTDIGELNLKENVVLYTSQEDEGLYYKSFLEDFLYALTLAGANIVPSYQFLKAHENKVFFEMLIKTTNDPLLNNLQSWWFGTYEDFITVSDNLHYPVVIKTYHGSMSRGVYLVKTKRMAEKKIDKISKSGNLYLKCRDTVRLMMHKGYIKESWNRKKFIVQEYIPGLKYDFKILVYGLKYYVLKRESRPGDFRASGQGRLSFVRELPDGLLDFAEGCFNLFTTPQVSLDIAYDGNKYYLLEAQFIYFGTYTIENSNYYFIKEQNNWTSVEKKSILEEEYVESIIRFLIRKKLITVNRLA